jgi:hypothetical protein
MNAKNTGDSETNQVAHELARFQSTLDSVSRRLEQRTKDPWDKAAVVAQFLSGTVIAILGAALTLSFNRAEERSSSQQQFAQYLEKIIDTQDPDRRAKLIAALDVAVPEQAVGTATDYALSDPAELVREQAIQMLAHHSQAKATLLEIAKSSRIPDNQLAAALLGTKVTQLLVRLSAIDDIGELSINGKTALKTDTTHGDVNDSGWVNVTSYLKPGRNSVRFLVTNGPYGGWGGRLQISGGAHQYDSGLLQRNACPCNAPAFSISVQLVMDSTGVVSLDYSPPVYF